MGVIGLSDKEEPRPDGAHPAVSDGSLADFGIKYRDVPFGGDWETALKNKPDVKVVYIQRSRGYSLRRTIPAEEINEIIKRVRELSDAFVIVDNCYGEFADETEPEGDRRRLAYKEPGGESPSRAGISSAAAARLSLPDTGLPPSAPELKSALRSERTNRFIAGFSSRLMSSRRQKRRRLWRRMSSRLSAAMSAPLGTTLATTLSRPSSAALRNGFALSAAGFRRRRRLILILPPSRGICPDMTTKSSWRRALLLREAR